MKTIQHRLLFFLAFLFSSLGVFAQKTPLEIKYLIMDLRALRYYPFTERADSIIMQIIEKKEDYSFQSESPPSKKTSVNFVINQEFLQNQIAHSTAANDILYKNIIKPYQPWLQYAAPLVNNEYQTALTLGLHQGEKNEGIYEFLGKQNIANVLDGIFEEVDLFQNKNHLLLSTFKSPLTKKNRHLYHYYISSEKIIDGQLNYEIVFFPKDSRADAFTGYLYVTKNETYRLKRAFFTINNWRQSSFAKDILLIQTFENQVPKKKEYLFTLGDDIRGALLVNRTVDFSGNIQVLTPAEKQVANISAIASQTPQFRNLTNLTHLALTDHLPIKGKSALFEWGPVTHTLSYNDMEGFRFRLSGNTTTNLHNHWLLGGYLAYGTKDERLKYRGNIIYSFLPKEKAIWEFPKRLLSFSYIHDLNIPGQNLLTTTRDRIFYSFSHVGTYNMSLQKLANIDYEHEWGNRLSFKIGGKYLYDQPMGRVQYPVPYITTTEMNFALRYSPHKIFLQNREKRISLQRGTIEWEVNHRIGLQGVFNSDYHYHITNANAYTNLPFPKRIGNVEIRLAAGKVWNRVPFPLLFIPSGNHSYIFEPDKYNLLDYYELITDNFVSGKVNFFFNWSPLNLFSNSNVRTSIGTKILYGPLSDNNNPALHPELFVFNGGIQALGNTPYAELNIGLANVLKILRVEWVQRLTYLENDEGERKNRGGPFVTANVSF
jgi:hypothetical protein